MDDLKNGAMLKWNTLVDTTILRQCSEAAPSKRLYIHEHQTVTINTTPPSNHSYSTTPPRILLIDNNLTHQTIIVGMLAELGLPVDTVSNIANISVTDRLDYHLILINLQSTEQNGNTIAEHIRERYTNAPNTNVIVITIGTALTVDIKKQYLDAGTNDYLTMPVSYTQLSKCIHHWLPETVGLCANVATSTVMPTEPAA